MVIVTEDLPILYATDWICVKEKNGRSYYGGNHIVMKTSVRVEVALMMGETGNTTQQHIRDDQTSEDGYIGPVLLVFKRHVAPLSQPPLAAFLND